MAGPAFPAVSVANRTIHAYGNVFKYGTLELKTCGPTTLLPRLTRTNATTCQDCGSLYLSPMTVFNSGKVYSQSTVESLQGATCHRIVTLSTVTEHPTLFSG